MEKMKTLLLSRSKNFWALEFSYGLHFIALSISAIFIPILMLELGFSLQEIILYYVIFHGLNVIFHIPAEKFLVKQGLKRTLTLGTIFAGLFFIAYIFLEEKNWIILLAMAFLAALYDAFYFIAYFFGFMRSTENIENNAENNTILNIIGSLSLFIGPLVGAFIILFWDNKNLLLGATLLFFTLSLIPLFHYKRKQVAIDTNKVSLKQFFKNSGNKKNYLTLIFFKMTESAETVLWPVFVFLIFQSIDSVAYIAILVIVASLFFTYLSGSISKEKREKVIIAAASFLLLLWLGRIFTDNTIYLYASSVLTGIFALFIKMPLDGNIFRHGEETNILQEAVLRNVVGMGSKFVFYAIICGLLFVIDLQYTFVIAIIALVMIIISNVWYLRTNKKPSIHTG